jgi:hypothetical protein
MGWIGTEKTVAAASTPERLVAVSTKCNQAILQVKRSNTGAVYIWTDNSVSSTKCIELPAPATGTILASFNISSPIGHNPEDLHDFWIGVAVNGEGVNILREVF